MTRRIVGIDILKIFSMAMIVCWHMLGHGSVLEACIKFSKRYYLFLLIQTICICAVNCYAIISGYVNFESKKKIRNLIKLYLQVFFYSFILALLMSFITKTKFEIQYMFPIYKKTYWYFSCYFLVILLSYSVDEYVKSISRKTAINVFIIIFIFICGAPCIFKVDVFSLNSGYSSIWLTFLYLVGAMIKRFDFFSKKNLKFYITICAILLLFSYFWKITFDINRIDSYSNIFLKYNSPTIFLYSVFLFAIFLNINLSNNGMSKFLIKISNATFGVYLIHDHPLIRRYFIKQRLSFISSYYYNILESLFVFFIIAILIYTMCIFIEIIRTKLFKILGVDRFIDTCYELIRGKIDD